MLNGAGLRRRTRQSGPLGELFDHSKFEPAVYEGEGERVTERACVLIMLFRCRCLQHRVGCLDLFGCDELWSIMVHRVGDVWLYVQCHFRQLVH